MMHVLQCMLHILFDYIWTNFVNGKLTKISNVLLFQKKIAKLWYFYVFRMPTRLLDSCRVAKSMETFLQLVESPLYIHCPENDRFTNDFEFKYKENTHKVRTSVI